jgi:amino acid transporter
MTTPAHPPKPLRTVGLLGTALLPLNGMIGAGIFALPATLYLAVGEFAPWMLLLGGLLFLPLIVVFAALARQFDHSGGPALYGNAAFGPFLGFQAGWTRYASSVGTIAANAHVVITYAATLWPGLDGPVARPVAVALFLVFFVAVNLTGMNRAVGTLGLVTAIKLAPLAALIGAGFAQGALDPGPELGLVLPRFSDAEAVVLLTFYAFTGFENGVIAAGEMKRPRRDIPLALIGTLALTTLLYMAIVWAYLAIVRDPATGGEMALAVAADEAFGRLGTLAIVIAAAFSVGGNTLNSMINTARLSYGMAEMRMLPGWFRHVSPRFLTPDVSIVFLGACSIAFSLTGGFVILSTAATLSRLMTYLICSAAVPVLRWRGGRTSGADIGWIELAMAALAFAVSVWVATHTDMRAWLTLGAILVVGTGLYLMARRRPRIEQPDAGEVS